MHGHGRREEPHTLAQQRRYRQLCAALAKAAPFDEESRRDVTERVCGKGVRSTATLSKGQMAGLIREMIRLCRNVGISGSRTSGFGTKPQNPAVPHKWSQDEYISHLAGELGWTCQPERLEGFCARVFGHVKGLTLLTLNTREKSRFIAALRGLLADQRRGAAFRDRPATGQTTKDGGANHGEHGERQGMGTSISGASGLGAAPKPQNPVFHFVPGGLSVLTR